MKNNKNLSSLILFTLILTGLTRCTTKMAEMTAIKPYDLQKKVLPKNPNGPLNTLVVASFPSSAVWGQAFYVKVSGAGSKATIPISLSAGPGALTIGAGTNIADTYGNATIRLSVIQKNNSQDGIGSNTISIGGNLKTIQITFPSSGWSWDSKFRWPITGSTEQKILSEAEKWIGKIMYSKMNDGVIDMWLTDFNSQTSNVNFRAAWNYYKNYRKTSGSVSIPPSGSAARNSMNSYLIEWKTSNGDDVPAILQKMATIYASNSVATIKESTSTNSITKLREDKQFVLDFFGVMAMCKEFRDRVTKVAVSIQKRYPKDATVDAGVLKTGNSIRPGMIFVYKTLQHTGIIRDVYTDNSGNITKYKVIEANQDSGWFNPIGQPMWARTIKGGTREILISNTDFKIYAY